MLLKYLLSQYNGADWKGHVTYNMGGGDSPAPQPTQTSTVSIPEYARPTVERMVGKAEALTNAPYQTYGGQRIAESSGAQQAAREAVAGMGPAQQFGTATGLAGQAGLAGLAAGQFGPATFEAPIVEAARLRQFQMQAPSQVSAMERVSPQMLTARTGFAPQLERFQIEAPERFGATAAQEYMSPYMQGVVDVQKREAIRSAQQGQLAQNLAAARAGTYGGARQTLAATERERALGQQLGDIQTRGLQAAYEQAGTQFERDRAARMAAQQANLQAALGVQQLGTTTGLQTALANLSSEQQANVQNLAAQLQTQGMNADQALRAALANQQAGLTVGQQNLAARLGVQQLGAQQGLEAQRLNQQALMEAQRLGEQSRQFGGTLGLQGAQAATQAAGTLGQLGAGQQAAGLELAKAQETFGGLGQQERQRALDLAYQDFITQQQYPYKNLGFLSDILRGSANLAATGGKTVYEAPPSLSSQLVGAGLGAASLYKMMG